jgi:hypothetical protein
LSQHCKWVASPQAWRMQEKKEQNGRPKHEAIKLTHVIPPRVPFVR